MIHFMTFFDSRLKNRSGLSLKKITWWGHKTNQDFYTFYICPHHVLRAAGAPGYKEIKLVLKLQLDPFLFH